MQQAEVCAAQSSQECASETQNMVLVQPTMCCSTIVGRNVLRPNSRTQSWKNVKVCAAQSWKYVRHNVESMCGTAHRNAAFGAHRHQQRRRVSRQQVSAFHTFLNEEFLAPPTSVVACGLSGAVSLWRRRALVFGGWANIWGLWNPESGSKETFGSCSNRKFSTFHTFLIEEFLAPTIKRHCLGNLEHLEPGEVWPEFISSCSSMRPEQEQAFNSSGVNIWAQNLDLLTWDLSCGFSESVRKRCVDHFYPEIWPPKKRAITFLNTFQYFSAQTFWAKKFLAFCCDPLSRDLRGRGWVDYLDEKRVILGGSIRVLTCRTI